jgi:PadR family transcriptional regulator AphA
MEGRASPSLLGILSLRPMSGYDIRKFVGESIGYFWKESYGQIYPELKRMAAQGLVKVRIERQKGKPDRQVYSLTAKGLAELETWMAKPPRPPSPRNELLLKLFFARRGKAEDMVRHVQEFRHHQEELLEQYSGVEKWLHRKHVGHPDLPYWLITLQYGKRHSRAQLAWSVATLRTLDRLTSGSQARNRNTRRGKNP